MKQKVQELKEALAVEFKDVELTEDKLVEVERWIDGYVHKNWVIMGSFHITCEKKDEKTVEIKPLNIYTGVMLEEGRVKMDQLEADRYNSDEAVYLWRDNEMFKCLKPENKHEILATL